MVCPVTGRVRKVHEPHQNDYVGTLFFMLFLKKSVFALCRAHSVGANHGRHLFGGRKIWSPLQQKYLAAKTADAADAQAATFTL